MSTPFDDIQSLIAGILNDDTPDEPQGTTDAAIGIAEQAEERDLLSKLPEPEAPCPDEPVVQQAEAQEDSCVDAKNLSDLDVDNMVVPMPTFTTEELAAATDIRSFAMLVTLTTSRWQAKVKSTKAAKDAAAANDADINRALSVQKHLLPGSVELKRIHKAIDEARTAYYKMTLPWSTVSLGDVGRRSGARLIANTMFQEYIAAMHTAKTKMEAALADFVPKYPALVQQARTDLGRLFDPNEYPPTSEIESRFGLDFDFQPIPAGHDFKGLPQQQLDALATAMNRKTQQMMEGAMQDVWVRLYKAVANMAERLSSPDKMFHHTLVGNVRDVNNMLKHFNITNDQRISALQEKVERELCQHEVDDLRDKPVTRQRVAASATSILSEMNKIGGQP